MPLPITTPRLVLRLGEVADIPAILSFYEANREHLKPWEPTKPADFYTAAYWRARLNWNHTEYSHDQAVRLFLFLRQAPATTVIGAANFSAFNRGPAQMCTLGYNLDAAHEGQGYMREALEAAIAFVFDELGFHRIQANYQPQNTRSGGLLKRLGFEQEGFAKDYLLIDGAWRDHVLTSLTNPRWRAPTLGA